MSHLEVLARFIGLPSKNEGILELKFHSAVMFNYRFCLLINEKRQSLVTKPAEEFESLNKITLLMSIR